MELLPENLKCRLPPIHSQEAADEPMVYARYFLPVTRWAWYPIEGEGEDGDFLFYGFVSGLDDEFGHFRLSELQSIRSPRGATVERDFAFVEGKLTDVVSVADL